MNDKQKQNHAEKGLYVLNSFQEDKVQFASNDRPLSAYICGPTVYDSAHMGHARTYVTFDIIRRILTDYFGYDLIWQMNVTDIDDKIIARARRSFLIQEYESKNNSIQKVSEDVLAAVQVGKKFLESQYSQNVEMLESLKQQKNVGKMVGEKLIQEQQNLVNEAKMKLDRILQNLKSMEDTVKIIDSRDSSEQDMENLKQILFRQGSDYLADSLDQMKGSDITDLNIFQDLANKYEKEFLEEMDMLNVRRPNLLTRVSDFVPQIIEYIQKIINNKMAYEANGSVYFDTKNFIKEGHTYGKLAPWAVDQNAILQQETSENTTGKKNKQDFALWKNSKRGEPYWESPWGKGRPGWHIECSAMASHYFNENLDIHMGGEDLKFPHHDNEIAQAEAHFHDRSCQQWVKYFFHAGHLSIQGLKMSKSLKNFITIRESLQQFSPQQLRMMFVLTQWNKTMVYGDQLRDEMQSKDHQIRNFCLTVQAQLRSTNKISNMQPYNKKEVELLQSIQLYQKDVRRDLSDNFNTKDAMATISLLIKDLNQYMQQFESSLKPSLLEFGAAYVMKILSVFGLVNYSADKPLSYVLQSYAQGLQGQESSQAGHQAYSHDIIIQPYMDAFAQFREDMRSLGRQSNNSHILEACDILRDDTLAKLGIRLEDKSDGKFQWKPDDPEKIMQDNEFKQKQQEEQKKKKQENKIAKLQKELDKYRNIQSKISPQHQLLHKYNFNEAGEVVTDKEGKTLDEKALKKFRKEYEQLKKLFEPYEIKLKEDPQFIANLENEIQTIQGNR